MKSHPALARVEDAIVQSSAYPASSAAGIAAGSRMSILRSSAERLKPWSDWIVLIITAATLYPMFGRSSDRAVLQRDRPLHFARRSSSDLPAALSLSTGFGGVVYSALILAGDAAKTGLVRDPASAVWLSLCG